VAAAALPRPLAEACVQHLLAVYGTHCRAEHLAPIRGQALAPMCERASIPLVPLPRSAEEAPDSALFAPGS
jgi:hypothetical protein